MRGLTELAKSIFFVAEIVEKNPSIVNIIY